MARKKLSPIEQIEQLKKEEIAIIAKRESLITKRYLEIGKIVHKAGLFDVDNKTLAEIITAGKELVLDDGKTENAQANNEQLQVAAENQPA